MSEKCYQYRSAELADTERLAELLAELSGPGLVIALDGELGAGKTAFSKAFAKRLGVQGIVNSPTFTIMKEYEGEHFPFFHMDAYRVSEAEAYDLGLDDYFYGAGVTLVEWADNILDLLPEHYLHLRIQYMGEAERLIELIPYGEPYETWCEELKTKGVMRSCH